MNTKCNVKPIDITALIENVECGKTVDPVAFTSAVQSLNIAIKIFGLDNVDVIIYQEDLNIVHIKASKISERARAVLDICSRILDRDGDYSSGRLEARLGIKTPLEYLLYGLEGFDPSSYERSINALLTICDVINWSIERVAQEKENQ